jgi:hypothetical protein
VTSAYQIIEHKGRSDFASAATKLMKQKVDLLYTTPPSFLPHTMFSYLETRPLSSLKMRFAYG